MVATKTPRVGLLGVVRQRRLLVGVFLDTFGTGAFYPLTFLYLTEATGLSLSWTGAMITIATLAVLPLSPLTGALVDRFSAKHMLVTQNLLSAAGYTAYFATGNVGLLVAGVAVVVLSERMYWSAWPIFVAQTFNAEVLDRSYAVVNALKSASLGLGALAAAAALAVGDLGALQMVLLANIVSSLVTALIIASAATTPDQASASAPERAGGPVRHPWHEVIRDRTLVILTAANSVLTFAWLVPTVVLPIYLIRELELSTWTPSMAFVLITVLTVFLQTTVVARAHGHRRTRVVAFGALLFVAAFVLAGGAMLFSGFTAALVVFSGLVFFSLAEIVCGPVINSIAVTAAPPGLRGRYVSVFQSSWLISAILGPAAIGALMDQSFLALWSALSVAVIAGGVGFVCSERRLPSAALLLSGEVR